jgi:hypothetical protein
MTELGSEHLFANFQTRCRDRFYCLRLELCVYVCPCASSMRLRLTKAPVHLLKSTSTRKIITEKAMQFRQRKTPIFPPVRVALITIALRCLLLSFLAAFTLRTRLSILNKRKQAIMEAMSEDDKKALEENDDPTKEVDDHDPRYVFMT